MGAAANSNGLRVIGYIALVALALVARRRERTRATEADGVWPLFWLLTAMFLAVMALGRAGDIGSLIGDLGRGRAVDAGWYEARRPVQGAVVGAIGMVWLVAVTMACWKTPERRRRYLPMGVTVVTLSAFAAIRVVSLHQVDALLHRRDVGGIRVGTIIEFGLLCAAAIVTLWVPPGRTRAQRPGPAGDALSLQS